MPSKQVRTASNLPARPEHDRDDRKTNMQKNQRGKKTKHVSKAAFTHTHTLPLSHRNTCYTETLLHTHHFTQRRFNTHPFTHRHFYTQKLLHTDTSTQMHFHTQTLLHTDIFTQKHSYTQTLLHRDTFHTQKLLHTSTFTHKLLSTETL